MKISKISLAALAAACLLASPAVANKNNKLSPSATTAQISPTTTTCVTSGSGRNKKVVCTVVQVKQIVNKIVALPSRKLASR